MKQAQDLTSRKFKCICLEISVSEYSDYCTTFLTVNFIKYSILFVRFRFNRPHLFKFRIWTTQNMHFGRRYIFQRYLVPIDWLITKNIAFWAFFSRSFITFKLKFLESSQKQISATNWILNLLIFTSNGLYSPKNYTQFIANT